MKVNSNNAGLAQATQASKVAQTPPAPKVSAQEAREVMAKPEAKLASQGQVGTRLHMVG